MRQPLPDSSSPLAHTRLARLVAAVDFGAPSLVAARWAARHLAPGAELVLVHAAYADEPPSFLRGLAPPHERLQRAAHASGLARLDLVARELGIEPARTVLRDGPPADVVAEVAHDIGADLIVVGPHGGGPGLAHRLGSTAERLVRRVPVPVLVVVDPPDAPPRRLLVPVDDVDITASVVEWAGAIAARAGGGVVLLHVLPELAPAGEPLSEADDDAVRVAALEWLSRVARDLPPDVALRAEVARGTPADEVLRAAERLGADLVVMGRRGAQRAMPASPGSTASTVLRHAACSIFVVVDPSDVVLDDWGGSIA